jgi:hypothetical protein
MNLFPIYSKLEFPGLKKMCILWVIVSRFKRISIKLENLKSILFSVESVNDSVIDEIYLIIEEHCEQEGVSEAPSSF